MMELIYLSGTGHNWQTARWFADAAERAGHEVRLTALEDFCPADQAAREQQPGAGASTADPWGLFYPVYGFSPPWLLLTRLLKLPRGRGRRVFLVNARGAIKAGRRILWGVGGLALWLPWLMLAMKGYRVRGLAAVDAPSNWITAHPGPSRAEAEYMLNRSRPEIEALAADILAGRAHYQKKVFAGLPFDLLMLPVSLVYLPLGRIALAKMFVAGPTCDRCGLCARSCPARAVTLRPDPCWSRRCLSCYRCLNACPRRAIYPSHLSFLLAVAGGVGAFHLAGGGGPGWLAALAASAVAPPVLYPLLRPLARRFNLGPWTSLTLHWRGYRWWDKKP